MSKDSQYARTTENGWNTFRFEIYLGTKDWSGNELWRMELLHASLLSHVPHIWGTRARDCIGNKRLSWRCNGWTRQCQAFETSILPHLTYCSLVWHFIRSLDKRKLERLQERGLTAVFKDHSSPYDELLSTAKLSTLYNRRLQGVATLMFRVKHGICPTYISDLFNQRRNQYSLRNSDFVIPRFNTVTYGKHSTVEPRFNEPLYNDVLGITNDNLVYVTLSIITDCTSILISVVLALRKHMQHAPCFPFTCLAVQTIS